MPDMEYFHKTVSAAQKNNWKIGIYGLGQFGRSVGMPLMKCIGFKIDFASDKNEAAIQSYTDSHKEVEGISYNELISLEEDVLVMACVGIEYIEEVCGLLAQNPFLHTITIDDIMAQDSVLEKFYRIKNIRSYKKCVPKSRSRYQNIDQLQKNNRIAIYTCVTGGYDFIKEPSVTEDSCDYYLISDMKYEGLKVFQQIDINDFVPDWVTGNAEKNRWCKMHGHEIFKAYRYSIYIDGSITLKKSISHYINRAGVVGTAIHKHPLRNCIYEEGLRLIVSKRGNIDYQGLRKQMLKYLYEGMPREYGLFECGVIVRDHANFLGNQVMEEWFEEYMHGEKRDQLSLTYILWKNNIAFSDVGILNDGQDIRKNRDFIINENHGTK